MTFVCWQRWHASSVPASGKLIAATDAALAVPGAPAAPGCPGIPGCIFTVTFTGQPQPGGTVIPNAAAIPAAWMALNSRTRPGMKKHSMNPSSAVIPDQKKQQYRIPSPVRRR